MYFTRIAWARRRWITFLHAATRTCQSSFSATGPPPTWTGSRTDRRRGRRRNTVLTQRVVRGWAARRLRRPRAGARRLLDVRDFPWLRVGSAMQQRRHRRLPMPTRRTATTHSVTPPTRAGRIALPTHSWSRRLDDDPRWSLPLRSKACPCFDLATGACPCAEAWVARGRRLMVAPRGTSLAISNRPSSVPHGVGWASGSAGPWRRPRGGVRVRGPLVRGAGVVRRPRLGRPGCRVEWGVSLTRWHNPYHCAHRAVYSSRTAPWGAP